MGKLNKQELLEGVRSIIDNEFNNDSVYDGTKKFNIHKYVTSLIEEGHKNPELMSYLLRYDNALNQGIEDYMIFEQFGQGLTQYAKGNKSVKDVIKQMNETLAHDGVSLIGFQLIEKIQDPYIKDEVKASYNNYLNDKCAATRTELVEALEPLLMVSDPVAIKLNYILTEESSVSPNFIHSDFVSESEENELNKRLQEQRDKKKKDEIFEKVKRYIEDQIDNDEKQKLTEKEEYCFNAIANNQGLNLSKHINKLRHSDASKNERLLEVLNMYSNAINQGAYEERLYETFLHNISKYNYLLPVEKTIKAITEQVDKKREEITLTKLLEEMKDDHVSFIYVDLIQEDVARYVKEPNAINRVQLRNALMPYASDPYINEMFNIIYADNSKRANELSEKALNIKDQISIIRENATISNIYTPVQYIGENECVFNVNGQFYVKKGNNLSLLDEQYVDQLDDKFIELCQLVNDPHVEIFEDNIVLTGNNKYATIYEGYVDLFGHKESKESLRNLREMCMKYDDYDTNFYIMCSCLLENFNNIAKIDWAKHVTLNENNNISADLFKLNENIYITTHNDAIAKHTFYRNVNPIFCKNKLNEHMGINVSSLFSDLLPSQEKIILKLNETKDAYQESIDKYEDMIDKLKDALDKASEENKEKLEDAIKDATEKLDDIKSEYKEWQKEADNITGNDDTDSDEDDDEDVIREEPNEPMSAEETEKAKDELSQPLNLDTSNDDLDDMEYDENVDEISDEDNFEIDTDDMNDDDSDEVSDDEFNNYLNNDSDDDDEYEIDSEEDYEDNEEDDDMDDSDDDMDDSDDDMDDSDDDMDDFEIGSDEDDDMMFNQTEDEEDEDEIEDEEEFKEITLPGDEESEEDMEDEESIEDEDLTDDDVFDNSEEEISDESDEETEDMEDEESEEDYDMEDEVPATDEFGGDVNDPLGVEKEVIEAPANTPETPEAEETQYQPNFSYKIADVMFDENVKEGIKEKSGSVIVIVPMIDGTGKKYIENKTIEFYLNDEGMPILDNDPMSNELYAAVIDAIKSHPDYKMICDTAEPANEEQSTIAALQKYDNYESDDMDWEEEYLKDGNDEDRGEFKVAYNDDSIEDEEPEEEETDIFGFKKSDFEDEETEDKLTNKDVIPTYKSGNTEIELPAANVDNTVIPESKSVKNNKKIIKENIKITPVFKKSKSKKSFF